MGAILTPLTNLFRFHKLKMFMTLLFAVFFAFLLFPFRDLGGWIAEQVAVQSGGAIYFDANDYALEIIPQPGFRLNQVTVDVIGLPTLEVDRLHLMPAITSLMLGRLGFSAEASGLFNGAVVADFHQGAKLKSGQPESTIAIEAQSIKLPLLMSFLNRMAGEASPFSHLSILGTAGLSSQLTWDPGFDKQPSGQVNLNFSGLSLPSQSITVNFNGAAMPVPLPEIGVGATTVKAKVSDGNIDFQEVKFGGVSDDLSGDLSGQLGMTIKRTNAGVQPMVGAFDLKVNVSARREFFNTNQGSGLGLVFSFIGPYRVDTPQGAKFSFRIKGNGGAGMPQITAL